MSTPVVLMTDSFPGCWERLPRAVRVKTEASDLARNAHHKIHARNSTEAFRLLGNMIDELAEFEAVQSRESLAKHRLGKAP